MHNNSETTSGLRKGLQPKDLGSLPWPCFEQKRSLSKCGWLFRKGETLGLID